MVLRLMFILFVLQCMMHMAQSADIPKIFFDNVGRYKPREKENVTLSCRISNGTNDVQYFRDNALLSRFTDNRLRLKSNNDLTVTDLNYTRDDGNYRCIEKSNRGALLSLKKPLNVSVLGTFGAGNRSFDLAKSIEVIIGRPAILKCPPVTYTHPHNIIWGRYEKGVLLSSNPQRYKLSNGDFFFVFIDRDDVNEINQAGGASCIYDHQDGFYVQSVQYRLEIKGELNNDFAPTLRERIPTLNNVREGEEFSFSCSAGGKPIPDIKWYGPDGQEITSPSSDYVISLFRHKLTLNVVYPRLAGKYRCEVENNAGNVTSEGELIVQVAPSWTRELEDKVVSKNSEVRFQVNAKGNGTLNYEWYKNGQRIKYSNASYVVSGNSLTIKNVQADDYGYIQCFASNQFYEITTAAFLNVEGFVVTPIPEQEKKNIGRVYFVVYILISGGVITIVVVTSLVIYLYQ